MPESHTAKGITSAEPTAEQADAFRRVAESRLGDAYRLAGAILGSPNEAGDAVHDAFVIDITRAPFVDQSTIVDSRDTGSRDLLAHLAGHHRRLARYGGGF